MTTANWSRVSAEAKKRKLDKRKSERDIEREVRLAALGVKPIEVLFGHPLEESVRKERIQLEIDLLYPNRIENQRKKVERGRLKSRGKRPRGDCRTIEQLLKDTLRTAKKRASVAGVPFDLTLKDLDYKEFCPVLGIKFSWSNKITNETPSLDRMVPEKGYVKGNVQVISMKANRLKNNSTIEELEKILEYMKRNQ